MGSVTAAGGGDQPRYRYTARLANEIELRWQDYWETAGTFRAPNPAGPLKAGFDRVGSRPKFMIMDMFPYPSGSGLHVGHPLGYLATDVYARYLRMLGHNVLHPFGYDAFGLPAEQYAIETGQHPKATTQRNIATMKGQLRRLGLGHDLRRELATTDPAYYKWTQWIFLQIFNSWFDRDAGRARPIGELIAEFESGTREPVSEASSGGRRWAELGDTERRKVVDSYRLAYISDEPVNWCPGLGTVLANEEVTADGRSDIGNYPVYRRPLRQWMLRITAYAERLIGDLDYLDWPEPIKTMQRNWIGASDGAMIDFQVADRAGAVISAFTTRPDTLPGATYLVLAPEHPMVDELTADAWPAGTPDGWRYLEAGTRVPRAAVLAYRDWVAGLSDRQRSEDTPDKTGVFTGSHVINPMTGKLIPVFIADYVVMAYGSGAIMAVPAHDQRDLVFARRFGLPILAVLQPPPEWFTERGLLPGSPVATWPEAFADEGSYLGLGVPGLDCAGQSTQAGIAATIDWLESAGSGRRRRSYRLRDWLFSRQRYWGEPIPIVYDEQGLPIALPEESLPVTLPDMADFRPQPQATESDIPIPPLARAGAWAEPELDLGGGPRRYRREVNTMPQWAGSCWYYLRYLDPANSQRLVDPAVERYWMVPPDAAPGDGGVDLYVGGVEHAVLHLLYARFWHKVLYDLGYLSTREPFRRLVNQGYIQADAYLDERGMYVPAAEVVTAPDGQRRYRGQPVTSRAGKMGKSLKNGISPDDIYAAYGADTLRLYEMAMGPLDGDRPWRTNDITGVYRFLQRLWRTVIDEDSGALRVLDQQLDEYSTQLLHHTVKVVRRDLQHLRFNTAIARLMELNTHAAKLAAAAGGPPRGLAEPLVLMVAPFAPHIAEELWSRMGHPTSLAYQPFPGFDESLAAGPTVTLPVQINGKTRFLMAIQAGAGEKEIALALVGDPEYLRHTENAEVVRMVIVPGRIVNIVTRLLPDCTQAWSAGSAPNMSNRYSGDAWAYCLELEVLSAAHAVHDLKERRMSPRFARRHGPMIGLAWASATSLVLAGGLAAWAGYPAAFGGIWRNARELPGIGTLNKGGNSALLALSCGSPGDCAAGGYYSLSGGRREAFVAGQHDGTWRAAVQVPGIGALNKGGDARVLSLSCASAGNCAAGGTYREASGRYQAFVVTEKNGRWGKGITAPGTRTLNKGGNAAAQSVSCGRAGDCAAGGSYRDGASHSQAFVLDSRNGVWRTAKPVPGLVALNKGNDAELDSLSCAGPGGCSAGGFYVDGSAAFQGFVVSKKNGTWGAAREVPGLATLNMGGFARVTVVSCATAGNCAAGGLYHTGPTQVQAFVVTEANGGWGVARQVPGIGGLSTGQVAFITSLSCASAGNCSAAGTYTDSLGHSWPFVVTAKNGTWGTAVPAPGVHGLSGIGGFGEINSVSCASAGNCAGAGQYDDSTSHSQAFVIVQRGGTWTAAIKVPGLLALNKGDSAAAAVVSCRAPAGCSAGGFYHDAIGRQELFVLARR